MTDALECSDVVTEAQYTEHWYRHTKDNLSRYQQMHRPEFYNKLLDAIRNYEQHLIAEGREADIYTPL